MAGGTAPGSVYQSPQQIYQGLTGQGLSPAVADVFTALSLGREDPRGQTGAWNNTPTTGDYWSTGLFQFNLGSNFGPGGSDAPGNSQSGTDIWGTALRGALGTSDPFATLTTDPLSNYKAAAYGYSKDQWSPWFKNGSPLGNVSGDALSQAVAASGGQVTMAQLLAAAGGSGGGGNQGQVGSGTNNPAATQATINTIGANAQIGTTEALAGVNSAYAKDEAQFAREFLGLQQQQLAIQQGSLARQFAETPIFQEETQKLFGLERAGILAAGQDTNRQYRQQLTNQTVQEAGSGGLFTKGARDTHANTMADWASATASLQRSKQKLADQQFTENVQYMEKLAGLQDASKQLDIIAKRYGISRQEIDSRLGHTLDQITNGMLLDVGNLYSQLISTNFGILNPIAAGLPQPGQISGGGPTTNTGSGTFQDPTVPVASIGP